MSGLNTLTVTHGDMSVTVSVATGLMGMRRDLLKVDSFIPDPNDPKKEIPVETEEARQIMKMTAFPDYTCCLVKSEGLPEPLDFETFLNLPYAFLNKWGEAVYKLNPDFLALNTEVEDQKKRRNPAETGSVCGQNRRKRALVFSPA